MVSQIHGEVLGFRNDPEQDDLKGSVTQIPMKLSVLQERAGISLGEDFQSSSKHKRVN